MQQNEFTNEQKLALANPVLDEEMLKNFWANPYRISIDKKRTMLVNLFIGPISKPINKDNAFEWNCCIRVFKIGKFNAKAVITWMAAERFQVNSTMLKFLGNVGNLETEQGYDTQFAAHLARQLTTEEMKAFRKANPDMFENKIVPKIIIQ